MSIFCITNVECINDWFSLNNLVILQITDSVNHTVDN